MNKVGDRKKGKNGLMLKEFDCHPVELDSTLAKEFLHDLSHLN